MTFLLLSAAIFLIYLINIIKCYFKKRIISAITCSIIILDDRYYNIQLIIGIINTIISSIVLSYIYFNGKFSKIMIVPIIHCLLNYSIIGISLYKKYAKLNKREYKDIK